MLRASVLDGRLQELGNSEGFLGAAQVFDLPGPKSAVHVGLHYAGPAGRTLRMADSSFRY